MPPKAGSYCSLTVYLGGAFRRIVRCRYGAGDLVLKVRREEDLPLSRLASQCPFSEYLAKNGVRTARLLPVLSGGEGRNGESFAAELPMEGGPALVTAERFCGGQLTVVTPDLAEAMGELLARAHTLSERGGCHAEGRVLFDPFQENDLFSLEEFEALLPAFSGENRRLAEEIAARGRELLSRLSPFRTLPRCAVQGDLADCNLFLTPEGELGMFDFNNCGDNAPYLDAVMHGVYIARAAREAFVRLICTFWKFDLLFREDSLAALVKADDGEAVACRLARMAQKLDGRGVFA